MRVQILEINKCKLITIGEFEFSLRFYKKMDIFVSVHLCFWCVCKYIWYIFYTQLKRMYFI